MSDGAFGSSIRDLGFGFLGFCIPGFKVLRVLELTSRLEVAS